MQKDRAIGLLLHDLKSQLPSLPQSVCDIIEQQLDLMWQVGWDECYRKLTTTYWKHPKFVVRQYDLQGNFIEDHKTINQAAKAANVSPTIMRGYIEQNRPSAHGHTWVRHIPDITTLIE